MENEPPAIPLRITYLLVGYFHQVLSPAEQQELDDWVSLGGANQQIFEHCMSITQGPKQPAPEEEERGKTGLVHIANLILKYVQQSITPLEKQQLDDWLALAEENSSFFRELPQTDDMEVLRQWLAARYFDTLNKPRLN